MIEICLVRSRKMITIKITSAIICAGIRQEHHVHIRVKRYKSFILNPKSALTRKAA